MVTEEDRCQFNRPPTSPVLGLISEGICSASIPMFSSENSKDRSTVTSFQMSTAMPKQSKPGPMFALVAGTRTTTLERRGRVGDDADRMIGTPSAAAGESDGVIALAAVGSIGGDDRSKF